MKNIITTLIMALLIASLSCTMPKAEKSKYRIEAEDMTFENYIIEDNLLYSGGKGLKVEGENTTGSANFNFGGDPGLYTLKIKYVDEKEWGVFSTYKVFVNDSQIYDWVANEELGYYSINESSLAVKVIYDVDLNEKDNIIIVGTSTSIKGNQMEHARLDFVVLEKQSEPVTQIIVEAEDMRHEIYALEENPIYSGGKGLKIHKEGDVLTGTAEYTFTGEEGYYNIDITHVDEDEHLAAGDDRFSEYAVDIVRDGVPIKVDAWIANKELGYHSLHKNNLTVRHINGLGLKPNDIIRVIGTATRGLIGVEHAHSEHARFDCMHITLVQAAGLRQWEPGLGL